MELKLYLGGNETVLPEIRESNVVFIRCMTCRLLGKYRNCVSPDEFYPRSSLVALHQTFCRSSFHFAGNLLDKVVQPIVDNSAASGADNYFTILCNHLNSKSALQRTISALVITEWAFSRPENVESISTYVKDCLLRCLLESIYFDEIALSYTKILQDTKDYVVMLKNVKAVVDDTLANKVSAEIVPAVFLRTVRSIYN
jgi:TATA-binding protein-associated factor